MKFYLLYVSYPVLDVIKRLLVGDVIDEHDALGMNEQKSSTLMV